MLIMPTYGHARPAVRNDNPVTPPPPGPDPDPPGPPPVPAGSWAPDDLQALPNVGGNKSFDLLAGDDVGGVTAEVIAANQNFNKEGERPYQRLSADEFDGKPCYRHSVRLGDIVVPFGWDWPQNGVTHLSRDPIDFENAAADYILLRWHYATTAYRGNSKGGKYVALLGGHGWIGDNVNSSGQYDPPAPNGSEYGTEGWVFNTMSPWKGDAANRTYIGGMCSHLKQNKAEGENIHPGRSQGQPPPLMRWNVIDQLVDLTAGPAGQNQYRLYVNGTLSGQSTRAKLVNNLNNCHKLWVRNRHMHGGNPQGAEYLPIRDYDEFCGGFFVMAVAA